MMLAVGWWFGIDGLSGTGWRKLLWRHRRRCQLGAHLDATVSATETSSGSSMALTPFGGRLDRTVPQRRLYERAGTFSILAVEVRLYVIAPHQSGVVVTKGVCNVRHRAAHHPPVQ